MWSSNTYEDLTHVKHGSESLGYDDEGNRQCLLEFQLIPTA